MTEEVKDAKKGYEEYQAYLNGTYTPKEDSQDALLSEEDTLAENVLEKYAKIVRGVLCALAAVLLIGSIYLGLEEAAVYAILGVVLAGIIVLYAYLFWASIQTIVNISLTLKKINSKMK